MLLLSHAKAPRRKDGVVGKSEIAVFPLRLCVFASLREPLGIAFVSRKGAKAERWGGWDIRNCCSSFASLRLCESLLVLLLSHAKAAGRKDGVVGESEIAVFPLRLCAFARAHQSSQSASAVADLHAGELGLGACS